MIIDKIRNKQEFAELYNSVENSNLPKLECLLDRNDYTFCFYENDILLGCIYLEGKDGKTFLSGFSKSKQLDKVIEAVNYVCKYFNEDIYSETPKRHAKLALMKCGFKKVTDTILKRSK